MPVSDRLDSHPVNHSRLHHRGRQKRAFDRLHGHSRRPLGGTSRAEQPRHKSLLPLRAVQDNQQQAARQAEPVDHHSLDYAGLGNVSFFPLEFALMAQNSSSSLCSDWIEGEEAIKPNHMLQEKYASSYLSILSISRLEGCLTGLCDGWL